MAYQQSDLVKLDAQILAGVKKMTFADGRSTEFHSLDEMRRLRADIKGELAAQSAQVNPRRRFSIGQMVR